MLIKVNYPGVLNINLVSSTVLYGSVDKDSGI